MNSLPEGCGESYIRKIYHIYRYRELLMKTMLGPSAQSYWDATLAILSPPTWDTPIEREENERKRQVPICSTAPIPATVKAPNDP